MASKTKTAGKIVRRGFPFTPRRFLCVRRQSGLNDEAWRSLKFNCRRLLRGFVGAEGLTHFETEEPFCRQVGREEAHGFVVFGNPFDVAPARDRDAIFGAFELG